MDGRGQCGVSSCGQVLELVEGLRWQPLRDGFPGRGRNALCQTAPKARRGGVKKTQKPKNPKTQKPKNPKTPNQNPKTPKLRAAHWEEAASDERQHGTPPDERKRIGVAWLHPSAR